MDFPGEPGVNGGRALVLLAQLTGSLNSIAPPAIAGFDSSNAIHRILVELDAHPGITPSAIADHLEVDRSVVSRALARLDRNGIITRRIEHHDRRYVRVRLSARGAREMAAYSDSILAVLTEFARDAETLSALLGAEDRQPVEPLGVTPAIVIDRLAAFGSRVVAQLLELERPYGVAHWTQRFVLWAIADGSGCTATELADSLRLPREVVDTALSVLQGSGLVEPLAGSTTANPGMTATVTDTGADLVRVHAAAVTEHGHELVAILSDIRTVTAAQASA
ncbi:MarR family transcriptional regulator [Agromyces mangrovi Wang et al. 2018]|uniref:MarR family transcriptional regulator n=1 Tax=Agromyces mangrovi TaxID=1858653 RepID=UPI0025742414|nr:MarR family transcriptional regulator [Agromyces mangrovi]BDZ63651.1 hypothetical protein GCM10025877_05890 [Agromyces mangrovi]